MRKVVIHRGHGLSAAIKPCPPKPLVKLRRLAPSFGIILAYLENTAKNIYKTFLFFKIECWHFQNQFEKEFRETSQSFNSIRQPIEKHENNNCLNQPNELKWHPNFQWRFWSEPAAMTTFFARNENLGKLRKRPLT